MQGKMSLGRVPCFGCRRHHYRRPDGKSGLTASGLLNGAHGDTLRELRQTWTHRGDECVAICVYGRTNPFRMVRERRPRRKCGVVIRHPGGMVESGWSARRASLAEDSPTNQSICRWSTCCPAGADDPITLEGKSGLAG